MDENGKSACISRHKHQQEIDRKEKEAADTRGQAKAYTAVGAVGAAGWGMIELMDVLWLASDVASISSDRHRISKESWQKIAFATGLVTLGAVGVALYKHNHAHKLEAEKQTLTEQARWQDRIEEKPAGTSIDR